MIELIIYGLPKTQGSKTAFINKHTGKPVVTEGATNEARATFKSWREAVRNEAQLYAKHHKDLPLDGPVWVECDFWLPKPKSAPKTRRTWPIGQRSGDTDKLARAVLDALTGIIVHDDAQVVHLVSKKDYGPRPGVYIYIDRVIP